MKDKFKLEVLMSLIKQVQNSVEDLKNNLRYTRDLLDSEKHNSSDLGRKVTENDP